LSWGSAIRRAGDAAGLGRARVQIILFVAAAGLFPALGVGWLGYRDARGLEGQITRLLEPRSGPASATATQASASGIAAEVTALGRRALSRAALAAAVAGLAGLVLGAALAVPLERVAAAASLAAADEPVPPLSVRGRGEVARIADAVHRMAARLGHAREELAAAAEVISRARARLHERALIDPLTGLPNRRHLMGMLETECARSVRYGRCFSVLLIDIDQFEPFNARYGRIEGDEVLKRVSAVLEECLRRGDYSARCGGEEFLVLLPQAELDAAAHIAERVRGRFEDERFGGEPEARLTLSVGVACFPENASDPASILERAQVALREAKAAGCNVVALADAGSRLGVGS
jgi:diguanylate cyclase (GGDEF)-like protein